MISRKELEKRVAARKREMEEQSAKLRGFRQKIVDFIGDVKSRSVIYNLIKNLPLWKELEKLIEDSTD
ncbi:hypothetical protein [Ruminococcus sp.]|uniref:hypothetical protein n=1 Tax=Ruminococcus sp. TaxID=41978 RepID=UPI003863C6C9